MTRMTAREFREIIEENPSWAATLTEKTQVIGNVAMAGSKITHLSPLLEFHPGNRPAAESPTVRIGNAADFRHCPNLKVAAGIFYGFVNFEWALIEEIDAGLIVTRPNNREWAADFLNCHNLRVARGSYTGTVRFGEGIRIVEKLSVHPHGTNKISGDFGRCIHLERCPEELLRQAHNHFPGPAKERLMREIRARKALRGKPKESLL